MRPRFGLTFITIYAIIIRMSHKTKIGNENAEQIKDPGLAYEMAHAEKPYRDAAIAIPDQEVFDAEGVQQYYLAKADEAGYAAGREYAKNLLRQVEPFNPDLAKVAVATAEDGSDAGFVSYEPSVPEQHDEQLEELPFAEAKIGSKIVENVAGVIATRRNFTMDLLLDEAGISRPTAKPVLDILKESGLLESTKSDVVQPGMSRILFNPTEKFFKYVEQNPGWRREARLLTLAHQLGCSKEEAIDLLLDNQTLAV